MKKLFIPIAALLLTASCMKQNSIEEPSGNWNGYASYLKSGEVAKVKDEVMQPGEQSLQFDASALPAGVYIIRLQAGDQLMVRKLLVQ